MKVLYLTQSSSLDFFHDLHKNSSSFKDAAYVVTDFEYYKSFIKKNPTFEVENKDIFKEWTLEPSQEILDKSFLKDIENEYFNSPILKSAKIDRRLVGGLKSTYIQNDKSVFTDEELMQNIQLSFKEISEFIDQYKPDLIIGFICVTMIEYLTFHIARKKKIKYLNLRPSRVKNKFFVVEDIFDPAKDVIKDFASNLIDKKSNKEANDIIKELKEDFLYEGVIPTKKKDNFIQHLKYSDISSYFMKKKNPILKISKYIINIFRYSYLQTIYAWRIKRTYQAYSSYNYFKKLAKHTHTDYVLFPLHKEPEVQLLLHGYNYTNQIDVIENVAKNLPDGITMLVKEHPMAVGYRPTRFYKKINRIPNVTVIGPMENLSTILKDAKMLITISGTSAFEAILKKIPVIHFGDLPFEQISDNMIKKINNFNDLSHSYNTLIKNYNYDESEIIRYIETCIRNSVPLDFYSLFLKKSPLNIDKRDIPSEKKKQLSILEDFIISKLD